MYALLLAPFVLAADYVPHEVEVLRILSLPGYRYIYEELTKGGADFVPAYKHLLEDPETSGPKLGTILRILRHQAYDRSALVDPALKLVTHADRGRRVDALMLLCKIGSCKNVGPVALAMCDPHGGDIEYQAALTLAAIGDENSLVTFDAWLNHPGSQNLKEIRPGVIECRQSLQDRLDTAGAGDPKALPPKVPSVEAPHEAEVRRILELADDKQAAEKLKEGGEKFVPAYKRLLGDRKTNPAKLVTVLRVLQGTNYDRSTLIDPALRLVTHADVPTRTEVLLFVRQVGSPKNVGPVALALCDRRNDVFAEAAATLAAIGDENSLVTFDAWLRNPDFQEWEEHREVVTKCRKALKARLDKQAAEKKPQPPK